MSQRWLPWNKWSCKHVTILVILRVAQSTKEQPVFISYPCCIWILHHSILTTDVCSIFNVWKSGREKRNGPKSGIRRRWALMFSLHKSCFQLLKLVFFSWPLLGEYSYSFFFLALTWGILGEFLVLGEEKCTFKSHSGAHFAGQAYICSIWILHPLWEWSKFPLVIEESFSFILGIVYFYLEKKNSSKQDLMN